MTVDVKQIGVVADASDDVLVPDLGQQGSGGRLHCHILPFFLLPWQVDTPPPAVLYGLIIKTYWSPRANVSFGGPDPTLAWDAATSCGADPFA